MSATERERPPHALRDLTSFTLSRVINDGRDAHGRVVALGRFEGEDLDALVKLSRAPLPSDDAGVGAVLASCELRTRMPYSGGEYGYYVSGDLEIEVVAPSCLLEATPEAREKLLQKHVSRSSTQRAVVVRESAEMYATAHARYIESIPAEATKWVREILALRAERERLLHVDGDFLLNTDPKWTTHPSAVDLYCLGIYVRDDLRSLRDVRAKHLPALKAMLRVGRRVIEEKYGVTAEDMRVYVHYPPQFYHFHVHYQALSSKETTGSCCERAVQLEDIIDNVERDGDHYAKANLSLKMGERDALFQLVFQV